MHNVNQKHPVPSLGNTPNDADMLVGDILRRTRVHYNQSLSDVESDLRIRAGQLQAIEEGRTEDLPGKVYAIGFVRAYAAHLGLDEDKIVALYKRQHGNWHANPDFERPAPPAYNTLSPLWLGLSALGAILLIALAWWFLTPKDSTSGALDIPPVPMVETNSTRENAADKSLQENMSESLTLGSDAPEALNTTPNTTLNTGAVPNTESVDIAINDVQTSSMTLQNTPEGMILNVIANSWVEIRDSSNDTVLVSRVLKAGEKYFVPDRGNLDISIGNAGGIEIQINDHALGVLGSNGDVLQNQPLSIPAMMARFPNANALPNKQAPPAQDAPIIQE